VPRNAIAVLGSRAVVELLKQEGVRVVFGNPGNTELAFMDALAGQDTIRFVLCLQEAAGMAMADGYAQAANDLAVLNVHVAPGLGNAMGMLYDAGRAGSPVLITAGQQAQNFASTEPTLYADLVELARPLVKLSVQARSLAELPRLLHRCVKTALAPPRGPVFLALPTDVMNADAEIDLGATTRVATSFHGDPAAVAEAARILAVAERPVIVAGDAAAQCFAYDELVELAELLGAPVFLECEANRRGFPTQHPLFRSNLARQAVPIRKALDPHDALLSVGADLLTMTMPAASEPLPPGIAIVHIDNDPWQLGKNYPERAAILGEPKATITDLTVALRTAMSAAQRAAAVERGERVKGEIAAARAALHERARASANKQPPATLALLQLIGELLPPDAVIVDELISTSEGLHQFVNTAGADGFFGIRGGGIGWGLPGAIGVKCALPERPVILLTGDGSAMYSPQALWTAAHENIAVIAVIINNSGYRVLKQRLHAINGNSAARGTYLGVDLLEPAIDFVALAGSMGVSGTRVTTLAEFKLAFERALSARKPAVIDVAVETDFAGGH
jgi:benzoylformate decarboxylase